MGGHHKTVVVVFAVVAAFFVLSGLVLRSSKDVALVRWIPLPISGLSIVHTQLNSSTNGSTVDTTLPSPSSTNSGSQEAAPSTGSERNGSASSAFSTTSSTHLNMADTPLQNGIGSELHAALVQYAAFFEAEMQRFRTNGSLLQFLNTTLVPPAMRHDVAPKIMIANVGANGWADNLKCAIDLFLLALLDRRLFLINSRTIPLHEIFRGPYFNWYHPDTGPLIAALRRYPAQRPQFATRSLHPEMARVNLSTYFPDPIYAYDDFCCGAHGKSYPFFASLMGNPLYYTVLRAVGLLSVPLEVAHGRLQRALFAPRDALDRRLQQMRQLLTAQVVIGMHVRTKGPKEWKEVQAFLSFAHVQCMASCAVIQGKRLQQLNHTVQYFLAMDNIDWQPQAKEAFGDHASLLVLQPNSRPVHIGFTHKAAVFTTEAVLSTLVDWFTLAHFCTHLILCPSGYGLTAAWRGMTPFLLFPYDAKQPKRKACDLRHWCPVPYPTMFPAHWNFGNRDPAYQATRPRQARTRQWPP